MLQKKIGDSPFVKHAVGENKKDEEIVQGKLFYEIDPPTVFDQVNKWLKIHKHIKIVTINEKIMRMVTDTGSGKREPTMDNYFMVSIWYKPSSYATHKISINSL